MKKIMLSLAAVAFVVGAYAGGTECAGKDKAACGEKAKSTESCPAAKEATKCPASGATAKKGDPKPAEAPKSDQAKKS